MLARERNATPDQEKKLSIIKRSGQHLLSMINDILDLSKIEAERIELQEHPFDLVALIKEIRVMIQSRATGKGLSVAAEAESISFPYVKADMGKLRQIIINLLNNAVKFTDEGGITIRCAIDPIPEEPKHCHIVIEVEDTGPGIDPARHAEIFEPFVQGIDQSVRKGTGLGLSICNKYAEFMGGSIEIESEVGKGALFRVRLPGEIAKAADVKISDDNKPRVIDLAPTQKTWRILVADDNRGNLLLLRSLLEEVGFFVLSPLISSGWTCACRSWTGTKRFDRSGSAPVVIRFQSLRSLPALSATSAMRFWLRAATTWSSNLFGRTRSLR